MKEKAFESDWKKCLTKGSRFFNLIKKGAQDDNDQDVNAVKRVLGKHYAWILYIYTLHAATDTNSSNASYMGWLSFGIKIFVYVQ